MTYVPGQYEPGFSYRLSRLPPYRSYTVGVFPLSMFKGHPVQLPAYPDVFKPWKLTRWPASKGIAGLGNYFKG